MRDRKTRLAKLAEEVGIAIMESTAFRTLIREVCLRVQVEQEEIRRLSAVRTFFLACDGRGVKVYMDGPKMRVSPSLAKLGTDLQAVLTVYRDDIRWFLERQQMLQEKADARAAEQLNEREKRRDARDYPNGQDTKRSGTPTSSPHSETT